MFHFIVLDPLLRGVMGWGEPYETVTHIKHIFHRQPSINPKHLKAPRQAQQTIHTQHARHGECNIGLEGLTNLTSL